MVGVSSKRLPFAVAEVDDALAQTMVPTGGSLVATLARPPLKHPVPNGHASEATIDSQPASAWPAPMRRAQPTPTVITMIQLSLLTLADPLPAA